MNNDQLLGSVHRLNTQQLASTVPSLRPFGLDEADLIRREFVGWLLHDRADYPSWQHAFNAWVGATDRHWGRLRVRRTVCPECHGRRFNPRTAQLCLTCLNGKPFIDTVAYADTQGVAPIPAASPLPAVGDRVRVTGVLPDDMCPVEVGAEGTVTGVNELGSAGSMGVEAQISVDWDNGRTLMLLSTDPFVIVQPDPSPTEH